MALRVVFSRAISFVRELFGNNVSPQMRSMGDDGYRPTTPWSILLR
jgi:hypothetical protein